VPAAGHNYDDVFRAQLAAYTRSRGVDRVATPPHTIPRTTNADVRELVDYWNKAVDDVGVVDARATELAHSLVLSDKPGAIGTKSAIEGWYGQATLAQQLIAAGPPGSVYTLNANLWHAIMTLGTALSVWQAAPSKWDIAVDAVEKSAASLYRNVSSSVLGIGKYLLIGAGVLVGGIVIVKVTQGNKS
jgi:hypothetical protein